LAQKATPLSLTVSEMQTTRDPLSIQGLVQAFPGQGLQCSLADGGAPGGLHNIFGTVSWIQFLSAKKAPFLARKGWTNWPGGL